MNPGDQSEPWTINCGDSITHSKSFIALYRSTDQGMIKHYTLIAQANISADNGTLQYHDDMNRIRFSGDLYSGIFATFDHPNCNDTAVLKCETKYSKQADILTAVFFSTVYIICKQFVFCLLTIFRLCEMQVSDSSISASIKTNY